MVYRAVVSWMALGLGLLIVSDITGCKPAPKSRALASVERVSIAPGCMASGQHCFAMHLGFKSVESTGRQDHVAKLSFIAEDEARPVKPMVLVDPAHPQGAEVSFDACAIRMSPGVGELLVVSANDRECKARTYYDFTLLAPGSQPVADFKIDEMGNLTIVTGSVHPPFDVQLISTQGRSIYLIFKVAEVTAKAVPLVAFEWNVGDITDRHKLKAVDGWSYEFIGHNGTLGFYHATCLGTLPDDLTLVALAEQGDRTAELREWAKNCGSGG